ncbi:MAG: hypothetical protein IJW93_02730 [Clostridia bacterium]|nr:hypothetical protein [Clostridia bacterium]
MNKKPIFVYAGIWTLCLAAFWLGLGQDAMGYSLLVFYAVIPISIIACSAFMSEDLFFGKIAITAFWLGVSFMVIEYFTFSLANMITISFERINPPHWENLLVGMILSVIGFGLGALIKKIARK